MSTPAGKGEIAVEQGNRRIAREIHDDFGQRAAALAMLLGAARKRLPATDPVAEDLDSLAETATELSEDLRRFSHDLHPSARERQGLLGALRSHCRHISEHHGLEIQVELEEIEPRLPFEIELALFRVAQEALANALRHAAARNIRLRLWREGGAIRLLVHDDGRGFDPVSARRADGLGLTSIEERAELFGGRLNLRSSPGKGTELRVWIPLPEPATPWGQIRLLLRRHRTFVAAALLIFLTLSAGIVAARIQAERAREEALRADATVRFLEGLFQAANPRVAQGKVPDARELLERGSQKLEQELKGHPLQRARLLDTLGGIETELGLFDKAREHLEESLAIRRREYGNQHLDVAVSLTRQGKLARLSGKGDSVALYREALAIRQELQGEEDPDVILALCFFGTTLAAGGQFEEAETYLRKSLAAGEKAWGKEDPRLAKVLHNLGGIELFLDKPAESAQYLERALEIRRKNLPENDPDLLENEEAVGLLRRQQGRSAEAAEIFAKLLAKTAKIYGQEHPNYARLLLNLALAQQDVGHIEEAKNLLGQAQEIADRTLTPDHPLSIKIRAAVALAGP